ncbi:hypothetical protein SO802_020495 [Lithocarpus litseifolius]|uniref:HhH-GPD domain-containing protein n=1 Tax=Lithocarpus litseifolius TaxID=425828 RepID=A0AAW2CG63_9ROSI
MQKSRKRKQLELDHKPQSESESGTKLTKDPYPTHTRPTREECIAVRDDLLALHGFPKEFAKYRRDENQIQFDDGDAKETVLDGLVKTVLSQNTTEVNSLRAFDSLKSAFPTWEDVLAAESKCLENAIRCGGLAPTKASCIKNILSCLLEKKGKLCMEYLRDLSVDEIKAELSQFKGIGPKTVACVLMFNLQLDDFPVDTHVSTIFLSLLLHCVILLILTCLCRCLRLQRPLVGYQLWLTGTRHIFILINISQMNLSLILTVFCIPMVSSAVNAPRKWVSSKERNSLKSLVLS